MRALRWGCHAVVGVWCAALLAHPEQLVQVVSTAEPPATARVLPLPNSPEEVEPPQEETHESEKANEAPEASSPPPEPAEAAPAKAQPAATAVSARDFDRGASLLDGGGAFPALSFDYEQFSSFASYARAMVGLGARFVVVRKRQIVGTVDLEAQAVGPQAPGHGFSPRARDYTSEPGLASVARDARERFGGGSVVMMLVPRSLDAGLFGGLARLLSELGEPTSGLRELRGSYQRAPGGGVSLRVDRAVRRDGTPVPVEAVFDLSAIAAGTS